MSVKILYKKHKSNNTTRYIYNFILCGINFNEQFKVFGKITKQGLESVYSPDDVYAKINQPCFIHNLTTAGQQLTLAQNQIDKCNNYLGCNRKCTFEKQRNCLFIKNHYSLLDQLDHNKYFLKIKPKRVL